MRVGVALSFGAAALAADAMDEAQNLNQDVLAPEPDISRTGHWRPQIHFSPARNWLNDPNGLFRDSEGNWHLYYQYGHSCWPDAIKDWGHASSTDLYTWTDHPVAIPATARDGSIWSGSVVLDPNNTSGFFPTAMAATRYSQDNIVAVFTSWTPQEEATSLAFSEDGGVTFVPFSNNPVISEDRHGFRDPAVTWHAATGRWVMALSLENGVAFYTSTNLRRWTRASTWMPPAWLGLIECPQLVEMPRRRRFDGKAVGSSHVLVLSLANGGRAGVNVVKYIVGSFDGIEFVPEERDGVGYRAEPLDFGPDYYATNFWLLGGNGVGERATTNAVSIAWAASFTHAMDTPTADTEGWRHTMGGPREHWIDEGTGRIMTRPADTAGVRERHVGTGRARSIADRHGVREVRVQMDRDMARENPPVEIEWTVRVDDGALRRQQARGRNTVAAQCAIESRDGRERLVLTFAVELVAAADGTEGTGGTSGGGISGRFTMAREGMRATRGWRGDMAHAAELVPMRSGDGRDGDAVFRVRAIIDRSILEVYVNDGTDAGTMVYFADGTLERFVVRPVDERDGAVLKFDFHAVALRSMWSETSGVERGTGEGGDGADEKEGAAEPAPEIGEL